MHPGNYRPLKITKDNIITIAEDPRKLGNIGVIVVVRVCHGREGCVRRGLQEEKVRHLLVQSDRRDTTAGRINAKAGFYFGGDGLLPSPPKRSEKKITFPRVIVRILRYV